MSRRKPLPKRETMRANRKDNNMQTACVFCGEPIRSNKFSIHFGQCPHRNAIINKMDVEILARTPGGVSL